MLKFITVLQHRGYLCLWDIYSTYVSKSFVQFILDHFVPNFILFRAIPPQLLVMNIRKSLSDKIHSNVDKLTYLIPNEHNLVLPNIKKKS